MIAEYIDREKALECLKIARFYCPCAYDEISGLPAADVAPLRHGRWVGRDIEHMWLRCSLCGSEAHCATDYCPNCGARMDLEANDG